MNEQCSNKTLSQRSTGQGATGQEGTVRPTNLERPSPPPEVAWQRLSRDKHRRVCLLALALGTATHPWRPSARLSRKSERLSCRARPRQAQRARRLRRVGAGPMEECSRASRSELSTSGAPLTVVLGPYGSGNSSSPMRSVWKPSACLRNASLTELLAEVKRAHPQGRAPLPRHPSGEALWRAWSCALLSALVAPHAQKRPSHSSPLHATSWGKSDPGRTCPRRTSANVRRVRSINTGDAGCGVPREGGSC
jgi:hypothetical protein